MNGRLPRVEQRTTTWPTRDGYGSSHIKLAITCSRTIEPSLSAMIGDGRDLDSTAYRTRSSDRSDAESPSADAHPPGNGNGDGDGDGRAGTGSTRVTVVEGAGLEGVVDGENVADAGAVDVVVGGAVVVLVGDATGVGVASNVVVGDAAVVAAGDGVAIGNGVAERNVGAS